MKKSILNFAPQAAAYLTAVICIFNISARAQCPAGTAVQAYASVLTVQCGDTVSLTALGNQGVTVYTNNFSTCPGTGWAGTSSATCANPCGNGPSGAPGDPYLWMGSSATAPRNVTTVGYDVSLGGNICFDMRYASEESCPGPGACSIFATSCSCEGPDLSGEGVHLQYQKNGVGPWIDIQYWDPNGGCDANLINWNRHCVTIPPGAYGATTKFRWFQTASSDNSSDHWGIDNVVITVPNPVYKYDWLHDGLGANVSSATPNVIPTSNTTYTVTYGNTWSGGSCSVQGTVSVIVNKPIVSATRDTTVCSGQPVNLYGLIDVIETAPTACGISSYRGCRGTPVVVTGNTGQPLDDEWACPGAVLGGYSSGGVSGHGQIMYKKAELTALGITPGKFTEIALNVLSIGNSFSFNVNYAESFTIKMGCTGKPNYEFSPGNDYFETGLSTVFGPKKVTLSTGWNTFILDKAYDWDGVSNIVIDICYANVGDKRLNADLQTNDHYNSPSTNQDALYYTDNSPFNGDNLCSGSYSPWDNTYRPIVRFTVCYPYNEPITWAWSGSGLSNTAVQNPTATATSTTVYTLSAYPGANTACASNDNVTVTVNQPPPLALGIGSCSNGSTPLIANGLSFCNTTPTAPAVWTTNTLTPPICITVSGISPNAYPGALLSVFADINHGTINEVAGNAGTNATIDIKGPGMGGWTTLTGLTNGDKTWLGALPAGAGTPAAGADVNGLWCIQFKDKVANAAGATFRGFCMNFNQGNNANVNYVWSPTTNLNPASGLGQAVTTTTAVPRVYLVTATNAVTGCVSTMSMNVAGCGVVLPVNLISFGGINLNNKRIKLSWETASEQNSDRFEIERSDNAADFINIGSVSAAGNSSSIQDYVFIDDNPFKEVNYYRLKQVDRNGDFEYSEVISVELKTGLVTGGLRPVPAGDLLTFDIISPEEQNILLEVYDLLGKQMTTEIKVVKPEINILSTDVSQLPSGVYLLKITDKFGEPYIQKFVK